MQMNKRIKKICRIFCSNNFGGGWVNNKHLIYI